MPGAQLLQFIRQTPAELALFDREMRYLAASKKWKNEYKISGEVEGRSHYEIFPNIPQTWKAAHARGMAGETISADQDSFQLPSGERKFIRWTVTPWISESGEVGGISILTENIQFELESRQNLDDAKKKLWLVENSTQVGFWDWDLKSNTNEANEVYYDIFGIDRGSQLSYSVFLSCVHPEDREAVEAADQFALKNTGNIHQEFRIIRKNDGEVRFVRATGIIRFDMDGKPARIIGTLLDRTVEKSDEIKLRVAEQRYRYAIEASREGIWDWDLVTNKVSCSHVWYEMLGFAEREIPDATIEGVSGLLHPEDRVKTLEKARYLLETRGSYEIEFRLRCKNGTYLWISSRGKVVEWDDKGQPMRAVGTHDDITEKKIIADSLRRSQRFTQAAVTSMVDAVFLCDVQGQIILYNDAAVKFWRFDGRQDVPKSFDMLADNLEVIDNNGRRLKLHERPVYLTLQGKTGSIELNFRRIETGEEWIGRYSYAPMRGIDDEIIGAACSAIDITEAKLLERKVNKLNENLELKIRDRTRELEKAYEIMKDLSRRDSLTGLKNRVAGEEAVRSEYARMKRTGYVYCILMIDIDHFKKINDANGHLVGDEVLKLTGSIFEKNIRATDIVFRFGGEEFVVILPMTKFKGAYEVAEKIRSAVAAANHEVAGNFSVSIGVSEASVQDVNDDVAILNADAQLYRAKIEGRNRVAPVEFDGGN